MAIYYHITVTSRVKNIKKQGLLISHKKNVRISKPVIYLMKDLMHAGFFASEMSWKRETPVSILHVKVNPKYLQPDTNTLSIGGAWYEYHSDIPVRDIVKVEAWDDKAKKRHMGFMNRMFK